MKAPADLNKLTISSDGGQGKPLTDPSTSEDGVTVYFRDLPAHLIQHIEAADYVFGCVAWFTHTAVLDALAKKKGVFVVVQKEDFLRPDVGNQQKEDLRRRYRSLPCLPRNHFGGTVLSMMSFASINPENAVRCVGNHNTDKVPNAPRAHHKFLVFGRSIPKPTDREDLVGELWGNHKDLIKLQSVWTGSFNVTHNAGNSLENAVLLTQPAIVRAYVEEFAQVAALSESLNWNTAWSSPEWRLGT